MRIDEVDIGHVHVAEVRIVTPHAQRIAADICRRVRDYCLSAEINALEARLSFEGAEAMMTSVEQGLRIRLEADDLVMLHGIRILLQIAISKVASPSQMRTDWHAPSSSGLGHMPLNQLSLSDRL